MVSHTLTPPRSNTLPLSYLSYNNATTCCLLSASTSNEAAAAYDANPESVSAAVATGATRCESPAEASAKGADTIITMVPNDAVKPRVPKTVKAACPPAAVRSCKRDLAFLPWFSQQKAASWLLHR